jgi:hypothetical protein
MRINMLLVVMSLLLPPFLVANNLALLAMSEGYLLHRVGVILAFATAAAAIYYRNERDTDWIWLLAYKFFWVACLWWILPYAALTLRNTGWLTRRASGPRADGALELEAPRAHPCH